MNIFYLDDDPQKIAQYHCDKHVVKMIVESAQLLSNAHHSVCKFCELLPNDGRKIIYNPTHINHPCSIWVMESTENYRWLIGLAKCLCEEYTHRYGKKHKTEEVISHLSLHNVVGLYTHSTPVYLCMPDVYKIHDDPIRSYRSYYIGEKRHIAKWTKRPIPEWYY